MPDTPAPPTRPEPRPERLELRAALLVGLLVVLLVGAALYLMYARGAFESTQRLVLVADDSEGVVIGMDLTFSGFPIGRVRRIELAKDGIARIMIDVPRDDAHWLRQSSVFTLTRGLVGNTNLRAYSGVLSDPPLPDGAERKVLVGDATAEIPRLVATARDLVNNLIALTSQDSALAGTMNNLKDFTARANGPGGALAALLGEPKDAAKVTQLLDRTNQLVARLDALVGKTDGFIARTDGLIGRADAQVFGDKGVMPEVRASVQQLQALLGDARGTLQRVDGVLAEAQGAAKNVRSATTDLDTLRAEVESSLRKVDQLVNEINRKWPFKRDTEIKLP